jgi:Tol biopolymer transport system component
VVGSGHELVVYDLASAAARVVTSVTYNVVAPSFSPDGHEIAFTETNPADQTADKVRLVGTDGSAGRPLGAGWLAAWSPIGDRLAVLRRFYGPSPIDIVRPDGSNLARVADDASLAMSWSPDGRSLAYTTSASPNALTVVAADGSKKRTVITAQPNGGVSDVSWAPDGTKLLVVMDVPPPAGLADTLTQLFALDPGSLALRQLTRVSAYHSAPAWAADGHTLAFVTRTGFAAGPRVAVSNPDGSLPRTVTRGDQPSLSPDGSRLLVVRNNRIWVVQLPGGRARQLHPGTFPAWSPDGKLIAYLSRRSLWTIRADGRRPHQLLTTTATRRLVGPPVWYGSPERLYIATNSGAITLAADGNDPQPVDLSRASDGSSFDITATSTPSPDGTGVLVERYHDGIARLILLPDTSSLPPTALLTASYALQGTLAWQPTR